MDYYQFLEDADIHILDYSGAIDLAEGLSRMDRLENIFASSRSPDRPLKIVLDVRNTIWESAATHDALAKAARQKFAACNIYLAVVNDHYDGSSFENERWFTGKDEAIKWLSSR